MIKQSSLLNSVLMTKSFCIQVPLFQFGILPQSALQIRINAHGFPEAFGQKQRFSIETLTYYGHWFSIWSVIGLNTAQRYKIFVLGMIPNIKAPLPILDKLNEEIHRW